MATPRLDPDRAGVIQTRGGTPGIGSPIWEADLGPYGVDHAPADGRPARSRPVGLGHVAGSLAVEAIAERMPSRPRQAVH